MQLLRKQNFKPANKAKNKAWFSRVLLVCCISAPIFMTKVSPANFSAEELLAHVEIDGVAYGVFDRIEGLEALVEKASVVSSDTRRSNDEALPRIILKRDFVTDPSLYLWAKNIMHGRSELKDVHVVMQSSEGETVSRYVLKFCQPLSWTVEAANPEVGGFHEKIELAVQDVSVE